MKQYTVKLPDGVAITCAKTRKRVIGGEHVVWLADATAKALREAKSLPEGSCVEVKRRGRAKAAPAAAAPAG